VRGKELLLGALPVRGYTRQSVEVYVDQKRVATHERLFLRGGEYHQTRLEHMPKQHQEWFRVPILEQASRIGPATQWAIQQVLLGRNEAQTYNSCNSLAKQYSPERMERAAQRCQKVRLTACSNASSNTSSTRSKNKTNNSHSDYMKTSGEQTNINNQKHLT
jgi:hypothetical protein